jgi:uncharacterized protein (DUF1499 family)
LARIALLGGAMFGCSAARPKELGLVNGVLRPCPDTPNCVSSEAGTQESHRIAPLEAVNGRYEMGRLSAILKRWPNTVVVTDSGTYIHAEFTTKLMRFVDDVEFRYDAAAEVVHVRSASRIGRSDLGANRKRIEALRERLKVF